MITLSSYPRVARYCFPSLQDSQSTLEWALKTLATHRVSIGDDHPICEELVEVLGLLESAVKVSGSFPSAVVEYCS